MSTNELAIPFVYAGEVLAAAIVLPLVAMMLVGLRFCLRSSGKAKVGPDDWIILAAVFPVMGMGICLIYGTAKGAIGYPSPSYPFPMEPPILEGIYETTPEQTIVFTMDWIIWMLMIPGNGLIKLSALFSYRRIFVINKNSPFDIVTLVMIVICSFWTVGFLLAQIFGCGSNFGAPFRSLADVANCNTNVRLDALMITDLITDILVWALPIPVVWGLNMSTSKKLAVTGILSLAAVSLVAAIVRLIVQEEISHGGYAAHTDVNLSLTILLYWSMLESGLALIAACLPTLHLLATRAFINPAVDSVRRLLNNTHSTSNPNTTLDGRPYYEVSPTLYSKPSQKANKESYELTQGLYKGSDIESREVELAWPEH